MIFINWIFMRNVLTSHWAWSHISHDNRLWRLSTEDAPTAVMPEPHAWHTAPVQTDNLYKPVSLLLEMRWVSGLPDNSCQATPAWSFFLTWYNDSWKKKLIFFFYFYSLIIRFCWVSNKIMFLSKKMCVKFSNDVLGQ